MYKDHFHITYHLFAEMAAPNEDMDDAMMDIINSGVNQYGEFKGDDNNQEVDDGSQYLADYEDDQLNTSEVYLQSLLCIHEIQNNFICITIFIIFVFLHM